MYKLKCKKSLKIDLEGLNMRSEIYVNARKMAEDYPAFGVGPGAFLFDRDVDVPARGAKASSLR